MTNTNFSVGPNRDLFDIIDTLRSQGVGHYVDLPEIIVCGDQSTGKSSVLEAISGLSFPTNDRLCTRFATELILRRGDEVSTRVSIIPGESRIGEDEARLKGWRPEASIDKEGLDAVTDEAKRAMAEPAGMGDFYDDILRIELTGPNQPHLTMVDLPGLFRAENREQSETDVGIVRSLVERYMARPRSIILTVVSAVYDYVLQDVTSLAKLVDPEGERTMGLITKPDTLAAGSPSESYFVRLAQNREEKRRLGWHTLRNRKYEERDASSGQRDVTERNFFLKAPWSSIDPLYSGVAALRTRLSAVLRDQIVAQLPSLVQDVEDGIRDCAGRLDRLGPVRETSEQQHRYLLRVSREYTSLVTQAVDGMYTDRFFGNRKRVEGLPTRLRAIVRNRLHEFADEMRMNGQSQYVVDSDSESEDSRKIRDSPRTSRSEYVADVADRLRYSKGRELPGLFNPLMVNDLFVEQCEPWGRIARLLADDIVEAVHMTTELIVRQITAEDVGEGILKLLRQGIDGLKAKLDARVGSLLESATQYPITNNPQLTENVQRIQRARRKRANKKLADRMYGSERFKQPDSRISLNPIEFMNLMEEAVEPDMDRFGSALAVDYMEAYYKARVAVDRFIDDVSVLAVEDCLISKLPQLFRSENVAEMSEGDVALFVGETPESTQERERLEAKCRALETGLQGLKSLHKRRNVVGPPKRDRAEPEASEPSVATTSSRSEKTPSATSGAGTAPQTTTDEPSHSPDGAAVSLLAEDWST